MNLRTTVVALCAVAAAASAQSPPPEIVLRASTATTVQGEWTRSAVASAAGGAALRHPNAGAAKLAAALALPSHYFELTFEALPEIPYRLWVRGRADSDHWSNDSVFVQFSGSVDGAGAPRFRIGTTSATILTIEDCSGCGVAGWGWQDNGYGTGVLGPLMYFTAGTQTIRIQTREDGLTIDQIVLSPAQYLSAAPGVTKHDATILSDGGDPTVTLLRGPYLQQASATSVKVLWATLANGEGQIRYARAPGGDALLGIATTRRVPATTTGLANDYYQHEATLDALESSSAYDYQLFLAGTPVGSAGRVFTLRTAPAAGAGTVRFIAFGDSGTGSSEQRQLASLMAADSFDFALHAGDMAYGSAGGTGDASWATFHEWFFGIYSAWLPSRPVFPSQGNHDSRPSNGNGRAYLDLFSLPTNGSSPAFLDHAERYYSFDYGPVHVVALDTEFAFQDLTRRAEQLAWIDADLSSTTQPWRIAVFHRSPFSGGGEHGSDLAVRDAFAPLFERHGVQLSISAHEHVYERTWPLAFGGGPPVTYVVAGGGGAPLYPAGTASWTAYTAARHHYIRVDVDDCTLTLEAVGLDGAVFDGAELTRCEAPPVAGDVILYAADAVTRAGAWTRTSDADAAGGFRMRHPNAGAAKLGAALASPSDYFDLTFEAHPGVPYRLWVRGRADNDHWSNDSVFVQFDLGVDAAGAPRFRIGTPSATIVAIEDCNGCGVAGWGWQDNGYGTGVLGPLMSFTEGPQRIRVQTREDGLSIDQIVLSPERYLSTAPGALKNDTVILPRVQ